MIKLVKSTFYQEELVKQRIAKFILQSKHLSFGKQCEEFEKKFTNFQGRKHCVFVNSGSSANLALIQALLNLGRLKRGGTVGFSSITWGTNVMPLIQLDLKPIPIDIDLQTLNVSSNTLKDILNKYKLKALFLSNILGFCSDIDEIVKICRKEKMLLLEDNCESLGTIYKDKKLGNFGLASTFSFYVGHHMSTIEGGAICTDDQELADMLRIVRAHGWDRNLEFAKQSTLRKKFKVNSDFYSRYTFYDLGFNLRPTEINGFIGNTQIKFLNTIIKKRNKNFLYLANVIYKNPKYYPMKYDHIDFISNFAFPVICKSKKIRDELVRKCQYRIEIRPIVGGDITKQPFFKKHMEPFKGIKNARIAHEQGLYLGNNPELTQEDMERIISIMK